MPSSLYNGFHARTFHTGITRDRRDGFVIAQVGVNSRPELNEFRTGLLRFLRLNKAHNIGMPSRDVTIMLSNSVNGRSVTLSLGLGAGHGGWISWQVNP